MAPSSTNEVDQRDLYRLADKLPNLRELLKIPLGIKQVMRLVDGFERKPSRHQSFHWRRQELVGYVFGFRFPFLVYGCGIDWIRQELLGYLFGFRFPLLI